MDDKKLIKQQLDYYRSRAAEYDQWHLRQGRYDRGEEHKRQWFYELDIVRAALEEAEPFGECLELACGTGLWTAQLASGASSLTAIDAVPETIAINRATVKDEFINYEIADLFEWQPKEKYDFIFFGFWLSHVPNGRFESFWKTIRQALKPEGRVFFVDSLKTQDSTAKDHAIIDNSGIGRRKLNDGRSYNIVKLFYEPDDLYYRLHSLGWTGSVKSTGRFFYYGMVKRLLIDTPPVGWV
jgi:demethylmenaquinone methyltransferase/2-methoxy-6-polyprenyl-1,4-benzoquinol methylase